ncbi:NAD(P)H-binding protein [Rathayibacter sp. AY1H3]|uniref:NmrA family NAD(P)-binding protein n=1 Tax=Rathayibacter sp. AY1H3 TaxID=2080567 RepID=UPI000CE8C693|nr:NAD(P)H-binding protein [Rathayibacter sp. AY1H3]PPH06640.1 NAD(P)-dependent oxidoreductase [Rathayibacter sp. AY1H3]
MSDVIAITGVTGDVGGKTFERLVAAGAPVRAIVRRPEQAAALAARGLDARIADLGDGAALTAALRGADQLFLVTAATPRQAEHGATAVRAAQEAGVRALVQLSGGDAAEHSPLPWGRAIWRTDERVRASGLPATILHASGFLTNLEPSAPAISRGLLPQTMGRGVIPWIDTADIARVAAHVLEAGGHTGAEPVLTGPALLDGPGAARELTAGLGRRVRYLHLPSRVFAGVLRLAGMSAWQAEGLRRQFGVVARRGLDGVDVLTDEVERITGTPARSTADWARSRRSGLLGREQPRPLHAPSGTGTPTRGSAAGAS